jgi:pyruvate dehydrogenase E2 component (dihydrolipoamide acetyltransferase)
MPVLSPTMMEGVIARWLKKEGDRVEVGDPLCEIATDKSTVEYQSIEEGYVRKIIVKEGVKVLVNQGIAVIASSATEDISKYELEEPDLIRKEEKKGAVEEDGITQETMIRPVAAVSAMAFAPTPPRSNYRFPESGEGELTASPLAKKIAKEQGLDLHSVKGSGPHGRIIAKDLEFAQKKGVISFGEEKKPTLAPGTYEEVPLTQMRRIIGERLQASKSTIPHYYLTQEIIADRMIDLRTQLKEVGVSVTFNDFVLRAVALALRKHPDINTGYNSVNNSLIQFKTVDISLAVGIPEGLITPIICHADHKNILQISQEAKELGKKAKEGMLKPEEYQGGSFTVSNLGMYGILAFDAVINPPQAAILAVGGISERALSQNGKIVSGNTMQVTLSADHRVIDGAGAAAFLRTLKQLLENPVGLIL